MEFPIIIILLLLNGIFALYEIALVSSNKARLETLSEKGNKSAKLVLKQLEEPEKYLSTIQIGITLIGIISGAFGGVTIANRLTPVFAEVAFLAPYAGKLAMISVVTIITYLSLVVGELVPKSIALSNPERYATLLCPMITLLTRVSFPFVWLLSVSTKVLNKLLGVSGNENRNITEDELKFIIRESSEQGILDGENSDMLYDVFRFSDKKVNELMTYRKDVVFLKPTDTKEKVLETVKNKRFSKYILFDNLNDEVLGVVDIKDISILIGENQKFELTRIAQEPLYIPETLLAIKALEMFKKNKKKFAVIVNEYGGIEGIITLYDLTESVFGDVLDENEVEEHEIVLREDGSMLVDASMNIGDFMEEMEIYSYDDLRAKDFTTLGGLAMDKLERIPKEGDRFSYKTLKFEVVDMDGGRVDKLLVYKTEKEKREEE